MMTVPRACTATIAVRPMSVHAGSRRDPRKSAVVSTELAKFLVSTGRCVSTPIRAWMIGLSRACVEVFFFFLLGPLGGEENWVDFFVIYFIL